MRADERAGGRHLDDATTLDYLEDRLAGPRRRQVEQHLGTPCPGCHGRMREYGRLLEWLRRDRTPEVPAFLHQRALAAFQPVATPSAPPSPVEALARLLFDSWATPLPAAARRAVGGVRRLRFALGDHALELELEREAAGATTLRGWLDVPDPALHRIETRIRSESRVSHPDAEGAFAIERLPDGEARIVVSGPAGQWRLAPLDVEARG